MKQYLYNSFTDTLEVLLTDSTHGKIQKTYIKPLHISSNVSIRVCSIKETSDFGAIENFYTVL